MLTARPALRLEIVGHGLYEPGRARELGRARAQAVMAYLIAYGVAPARLVARGHRESLPPSGDPRAPHLRRIELRVLP